jgi:hypothetical protein
VFKSSVRGRPHAKEVDLPHPFVLRDGKGKLVSVWVRFAVFFDENSAAKFVYLVVKDTVVVEPVLPPMRFTIIIIIIYF